MTNGLYTLLKKAKRAFTGKPKYATGGFTMVAPYRAGVLMDSTAPGLEQGAGSKAKNYWPFLCQGAPRPLDVRLSRNTANDESLWTGKPQSEGPIRIKRSGSPNQHTPMPATGPSAPGSGSHPLAEYGVPAPPKANDPIITVPGRKLSSDDVRALADAIKNLDKHDFKLNPDIAKRSDGKAEDAHDKIDNRHAVKLGPGGIEKLAKAVAEQIKRSDPFAEFADKLSQSAHPAPNHGFKIDPRADKWATGGRLPDRVLVDKVDDARRADRLFGYGFGYTDGPSLATEEAHSGLAHNTPVQAKVNGVLVNGFLDRIEGQKDAIKVMKIQAVPDGVYVEAVREYMTLTGGRTLEEETAIQADTEATLVITGGRYRPDEDTLKTWSA